MDVARAPPPGSDGGPGENVGALPANPGPARVDAPRKGAKRVGVATLRAASADASVRALLRDAAAINAALRRDARAHERDADELRAAVDHAHGELRALADIAETRERDALTRCVLVVNEKNAACVNPRTRSKPRENEVARLERRAEGADGGADPDEDDGLGVDTDEEREAERREVERRRRAPPRDEDGDGTGTGRDGGRGRAKAKTETDPRAKTETDPRAKTETDPRAKTETDPRAKTETDPRATDPDPSHRPLESERRRMRTRRTPGRRRWSWGCSTGS